jgi:multicomponent Na+:H+ antiporter subunit G
MIDALQNYIAGVLVVVGAAFTLVAAVGLLRLPDLYSRMHAASKAGTLGSGVMLLALAVYADEQAVTLRALAGVAFFLLTAPVSAHLLAKVSYSAGYRLWAGSVHDDMPKSPGGTGGRV